MRILAILAILVGFGAAGSAQAGEDHDFTRPYLERGQHNHSRALWERDDWVAENWTRGAGSTQNVMTGLYKAGLIIGQNEDDGALILEVGDAFVRAGAQEQRRIAAYVDDLYGVTKTSCHGMFFIEHGRTDQTIGAYTKYGLQLH